MWPNPQETAGLVTFTEETLNGRLHFLWTTSFLLTSRYKDIKINLSSKVVILKNNLPNTLKMAVFIVLDYDKSVGMQWIAFNANGNTATYFDSFGVELIPEKSRNLLTTTIL